MLKGDAFGMQIEAVGSCTVENVAFDGVSEPFGMGTVDAQLMSATCVGIEFNASIPFIYIMCDGRLAIALIHHLAW